MNDEQGIDTTGAGGFETPVEVPGTLCSRCQKEPLFTWHSKTSKICITCLGRAIQELIDQLPDEDDDELSM